MEALENKKDADNMVVKGTLEARMKMIAWGHLSYQIYKIRT